MKMKMQIKPKDETLILLNEENGNADGEAVTDDLPPEATSTTSPTQAVKPMQMPKPVSVRPKLRLRLSNGDTVGNWQGIIFSTLY